MWAFAIGTGLSTIRYFSYSNAQTGGRFAAGGPADMISFTEILEI